MAQSKSEKIAFVIKHAGGNTPPGDIAEYYHKQTEAVVEEAYQHVLQGERQRITASNEDLKKAEAAAAQAIQARDQEYSNMIWSQICNTPVTHTSSKFNNKVCEPTTANRMEVASWPHDGERPSGDWFRKVISEQPFLADRLSWREYLTPSAEKARNTQVEAATRATFSSLARDYNLSRCESNVQAVLQHFPEGADAFQIGLAIQNHELNLAPCNKQEHMQFTQELEAEYDRKWKNMPLHEIRKHSAECNAEREALLARHSWKERGVLTKEDEAEARQQAIKQQEELLGFPIMPASIGETTLDAAYLKGCSRNQLMDAIRRWGSYQVNQRLVK
jgi:hypothetical protein